MTLRSGRTTDETRHELAHGPLDRTKWPSVGDEVLYHHPEGRWVPAIVDSIEDHDGDLCLSLPSATWDPYPVALNAMHGPHCHGWLLYEEAAQTVSAKQDHRHPQEDRK